MKKLLTIALSATLAMGVITPAHAETTVSGTGI